MSEYYQGPLFLIALGKVFCSLWASISISVKSTEWLCWPDHSDMLKFCIPKSSMLKSIWQAFVEHPCISGAETKRGAVLPSLLRVCGGQMCDQYSSLTQHIFLPKSTVQVKRYVCRVLRGTWGHLFSLWALEKGSQKQPGVKEQKACFVSMKKIFSEGEKSMNFDQRKMVTKTAESSNTQNSHCGCTEQEVLLMELGRSAWADGVREGLLEEAGRDPQGRSWGSRGAKGNVEATWCIRKKLLLVGLSLTTCVILG